MNYPIIDNVLLGLGAVWTGCSGRLLGVSPLVRLQYLPHSVLIGHFLQTSFLPPYIIPLIPSMVTSVLKMETVRFFETLASTSQYTRRLNLEEHHQYHHRRENLKSHIFPVVCFVTTREMTYASL
jgi:hypothetical protein